MNYQLYGVNKQDILKYGMKLFIARYLTGTQIFNKNRIYDVSLGFYRLHRDMNPLFYSLLINNMNSTYGTCAPPSLVRDYDDYYGRDYYFKLREIREKGNSFSMGGNIGIKFYSHYPHCDNLRDITVYTDNDDLLTIDDVSDYK